MPLNETLEEIILKAVYKGVKIRCKIHYDFSGLPKEIVEKIKTDEDFKKLKTLLTAYADSRIDIRDPEVFDALVEMARQDLGEKHKDCKEKRLKRFATLFKKAIDRESVTE